MTPETIPVGLVLSRTARKVSLAFERALSQKGGSISTWLILLSLMRGGQRMQSDLAEDVGIRGPTLTHHLNAMERDGLIVRLRDPANRRVHKVELTEKGRAAFDRLRKAAIEHDARLRAGFTSAELELLRSLLQRMAANVKAATGKEGEGRS
jgi:MarR family transcriptional regulator for hemolysin